MPTIERRDDLGSWHHVINRGLSKRPVFESDHDVRFFLSRIARVVRLGWIEVHAYSLLTTHFHLLVRSPAGRLSKAMRFVTLEYVRWFNRTRDRDGPLFRGRFFSRPIESPIYWRAVLAYIDRNAVDAGMVQAPGDHRWSSAYHYSRCTSPTWLSRAVVESEVSSHLGSRELRQGSYAEFLARGPDPADLEWIGRTLGGVIPGADLERVARATPDHVARWLEERARLADGGRVGAAIVAPSSVSAAVREGAHEIGRFAATRGLEPNDVADALDAGLLRDAAGLPLREIAKLLRTSAATAANRIDRNRVLALHAHGFRELVAATLGRALERTYGRDVRAIAARRGAEQSPGAEVRKTVLEMTG